MMAITTNNSMSVNPFWHRPASDFLCPDCFEVFINYFLTINNIAGAECVQSTLTR